MPLKTNKNITRKIFIKQHTTGGTHSSHLPQYTVYIYIKLFRWGKWIPLGLQKKPKGIYTCMTCLLIWDYLKISKLIGLGYFEIYIFWALLGGVKSNQQRTKMCLSCQDRRLEILRLSCLNKTTKVVGGRPWGCFEGPK